MKKTSKASSRREFFRRSGAATVGSLMLPLARPGVAAQGRPAAMPAASSRQERAYEIRNSAAMYYRTAAVPRQPLNGDEDRYTNRIASFSKSLPHNRLGEVEPRAFDALLKAMKSGKVEDFEDIPLGGMARLADPMAAFAYVLEGADAQLFSMKPPPTFDSVEQAADMTELYWHALLRDVPFSDYKSHPLAIAAAADLERFPGFKPADGGRFDSAMLFRGPMAGAQLGPYLSQYLLKDLQYGTRRLDQKIRTAVSGDDYVMTYNSWLLLQNGGSAGANRLDLTLRYILNGRDLTEYVHQDFSYQAFLTAALILLNMKVPFDSRTPYRNSVTQSGFGTFGGPHVLDLVARVVSCALSACWYQKWVFHRRLRPEEFGGRVHNLKTGAAKYPIHAALLDSPVLDQTVRRHGTYLLPQAYPEAAPIHPSYPAGHAVISGACATVLKAIFHEAQVMSEPVVPSPSGLALVPYNGYDRLTVGGELDKLAANITFGRNFAGIHYRSDGIEGLKLGEEVALTVLRDLKDCYTDLFRGFSLTKFDGTTVTV